MRHASISLRVPTSNVVISRRARVAKCPAENFRPTSRRYDGPVPRVATSASADEPLVIRELPPRPLGARDVRIRVRAIGVNPVDWKMRSGGPLRLAHRFVGPSGPLVVGVDFAGEVVERGPDADLAVGTRVVGATDFSRKQLGSYADEVVVRSEQCAALPQTVTFEAAACLPVPGATALRAFEVASVKPGDRVLVLGASGGVGLITLQLCRARGFAAWGVCSTRNVSIVEGMGATAIDYTKSDALDAARAHAPFQLILHAVGSDAYPLARCRPLLGRSGVDAMAVVRSADYLAIAFHRNVKSILGRPDRTRLAPLVEHLSRGEIEPVIEATLPLDRAEEAHRLSQAGKVVGKLLLIP
jgi:NADPH:quinone reductase-like Zn-dependent oxidoreductase